MNKFVLTPEIIANGLTEKVMSDYAGIPVAHIQLKDLPHWHKVKESIPLSETELCERTQRLRTTVAEKIAELGNPVTLERVCPDQSLRIASSSNHYGVLSSCKAAYTSLDEDHIHRHFGLLRKYGVDAIIDGQELHYRSGGSGYCSHQIIPGTLNEKVASSGIEQRDCAIILVNELAGSDFQKNYASLLGIPVNHMSHFPDATKSNLITALHEMRHLPQLSIRPETVLSAYYTELDADLFARSTYRQAYGNDDVLAADLNSRYLNIFKMAIRYFFAPALEALEQGREPPNFFEVFDASMEVQYQLIKRIGKELIIKEAGQDMAGKKIQSMAEVAQSIWDKRTEDKRWVGDRNPLTDLMYFTIQNAPPAVIFPALKHMIEERVFTNTLSAHIAKRITDAASYFCEPN